MSKRNSAKEKSRRREERSRTKLNTARTNNTQFYLVPSGNGYRRVFGDCGTCLLSREVRTQSEGRAVYYLEHECDRRFLTEEQVEDLKITATILVDKHREDYPELWDEEEDEEEIN